MILLVSLEGRPLRALATGIKRAHPQKLWPHFRNPRVALLTSQTNGPLLTETDRQNEEPPPQSGYVADLTPKELKGQRATPYSHHRQELHERRAPPD